MFHTEEIVIAMMSKL